MTLGVSVSFTYILYIFKVAFCNVHELWQPLLGSQREFSPHHWI